MCNKRYILIHLFFFYTIYIFVRIRYHYRPITNNFNMTPFIGYISKVMIKLVIYFTSHMRNACKIMDNMVISHPFGKKY